jgi:Uma2 family endonuclease
MSATSAPGPMTADEFFVWAAGLGQGRWELLDGRAVAMAPEQIRHAAIKGRIYRRLAEAIEAAGLPCEALVDGVGIRVNARTVFIPDVVVRCGEHDGPEQREVSNPVLLVEVSSPSTADGDPDAKLHGYFSVASVQHYLIVHPATRHVVHHRRLPDGAIATELGGDRAIRFDPPGFVLPPFFAPVASPVYADSPSSASTPFAAGPSQPASFTTLS